jgi:SAM-dependent methyltransferase
MPDYHDYVFDAKKREFVGRFEDLYKNEILECVDSWRQDDSRQLNRRIALTILESYNFDFILDIGSGKGSLTQFLKRQNNTLIGVDISKTALSIARSRFSDITFEVIDVNSLENLSDFVALQFHKANKSKFDLVFSAECLSYIKDWKYLLEYLATVSKYLMITLYIPENPIGYVKSSMELASEIAVNFNIIENVSLAKSRYTIIFAESTYSHYT